MFRIPFAIALSALLATCLTQCTDPTVIGGDLLDGNQLPLTFSDTLPISLTTVRSDISQVTDFSATAGPFAVGCVEDPLLGITRATIGFELFEPMGALQLLGVVIDSAILVLPLDTSVQVGDTMATVDLRVVGAAPGTIEVAEALTDDPLESTGVDYGQLTTVPRRSEQEINVFTDTETRIDTVAPQLRIPLNDQFLEDIRPALTRGFQIRDSTFVFRDSVFATLFPGLIVEGNECGSTLPGISVTGDNDEQFGVKLFYTRNDTSREFTLSFLRTTTTAAQVLPFRVHYEHDYSGTTAEDLLAGVASDDNISAVQSLDGLATRVEFLGLDALRDVAVNLAILEVPIVRDGFTSPLRRLIPRRFNSVGDYVTITNGSATGDGTFSLSEGGFVERRPVVGGPVTDSVDMYRFNLTTYFQRILTGEREPSLDLLPIAQTQIPGRSLLALPREDGTGARLLLATTELP